MAHSLEARVPFFDVEYISTAMAVNPAKKLIRKGAAKNSEQHCEKYMLRRMYEDIVAPEVLWRTKAMQCEGVGMTWVSTLQKFIGDNLVTDAEFAAVEKRFPNNPPQSKEEYYYRSVFDKYFPNCDKFIHVWKNGCRAGNQKLDFKFFSFFIFKIFFVNIQRWSILEDRRIHTSWIGGC